MPVIMQNAPTKLICNEKVNFTWKKKERNGQATLPSLVFIKLNLMKHTRWCIFK